LSRGWRTRRGVNGVGEDQENGRGVAKEKSENGIQSSGGFGCGVWFQVKFNLSANPELRSKLVIAESLSGLNAG
jgi:hypothetical protein